jgi:predicted transglutaminase-like cysteine proteinase
MNPRPIAVLAASLVLAACGSDQSPAEAPVTRPAGYTEVEARAAAECNCETRGSSAQFVEWASTTKDREGLDWVGSACQLKKTNAQSDVEICSAVEVNQKRVPLKGFVGGTLG